MTEKKKFNNFPRLRKNYLFLSFPTEKSPLNEQQFSLAQIKIFLAD